MRIRRVHHDTIDVIRDHPSLQKVPYGALMGISAIHDIRGINCMAGIQQRLYDAAHAAMGLPKPMGKPLNA